MQNVMAALRQEPALRTCVQTRHCWQEIGVSESVAQRVRAIVMRLRPKRVREAYARRPGKQRNLVCRHCAEQRLELDAAYVRYARRLESHLETLRGHLRIMRGEVERAARRRSEVYGLLRKT